MDVLLYSNANAFLHWCVANDVPMFVLMVSVIAIAVGFAGLAGNWFYEWCQRTTLFDKALGYFLHTKREKSAISILKRDTKEKTMGRREREVFVKTVLSDKITEHMEDLVYGGVITREECLLWYQRIGNLLNMPDLLPRKQNTLKEIIKHDRATRSKKPVSLPGDAAATAEVKPTRKPKNKLDAFLFHNM